MLNTARALPVGTLAFVLETDTLYVRVSSGMQQVFVSITDVYHLISIYDIIIMINDNVIVSFIYYLYMRTCVQPLPD